MSEDESKAFVVRDRRGRAEDKEQVHTPPAAPPSSAPSRAAHQDEATPKAAHEHEGAMPVTFSGFIFSLSTSAMMLRGEQLDSMLESKTRGNLATDEQAVLTDMLYALRMKYVDVASGPHSSQSS
jgi:hypothetical protein